MTKKITRENLLSAILKLVFMLTLIAVLSENVYSQFYEFSLNQRRRYDQIEVEIWAKTLAINSPKIGFASLVIEYNSTYLRPSSNQYPNITDSVVANIDIANPVINIVSDYNNKYGYSPLGYQNYGDGYYSLEVNLQKLGEGGIVPSQESRGSFIGKLTFDIINNPPDTAHTNIVWSNGVNNGTIVVFDIDSTELTENISFVSPSQFTVTGITLLSPNFSTNVVDRDKNYLSLSDKYAGGGYPIYFERSINPSLFLAPTPSQKQIDDDLGYVFEYSLDNGSSWQEFGRLSETERDAGQIGRNSRYRSDEIYNPNASLTYIITSQRGYKLTDTNYRKPVRVIWAKNPYFNERTEEANLRISILSGNNIQDISTRAKTSINDIADEAFVLGRLFFLQLNGTNEYLKTEESFSNATQLTVTAWINLNSINGEGTNPAIVASSLGNKATEINGSTEGAWMLYLRDGRFPAFKVREILGRGTNGYIADLYDVIPLTTETDAKPLVSTHSNNWVHLAATVNNNKVILYVNGEIVEDYTNLEDTDIRMLTTNHPIWIGVNPNGEFEDVDYLRAGIKEVQIWRTALTQEEIRNMIPGVVNPSSVDGYGDIKRGLEFYYNFEGGLRDFANNDDWQNGANTIDFYRSNSLDDVLNYRPDKPHIKLTTPAKNSGILNKEGENFEIRWVSYGLGDIVNSGTKDVVLEYSVDDGNSWYFVKNPDGENLDSNKATDIENASVMWEPWRNNNSQANLRSIVPYDHKVKLRIRGLSSRSQENLMFVSDTFSVARYFSFFKNESTVLSIPGDAGMNITGDEFFIEAWIRPYRFPTEEESFMTLLSKQDSVSGEEHYSLRLLSTGQIQFNITDATGVVRTATSDITKPLVSPNSIAIDTAWTHIGVYVFLNGGLGASEIRFYIDGNVQRTSAISEQLGEDLNINSLNDFPTYIGYEPVSEAVNGFIGEIRELRFWNGTPNNTSAIGNEPTEMTLYIQGALAIRAYDLTLNEHKNLFAAFSLNGRGFVYNGYSRAIGSMTNSNKMLRFHGEPYKFKAVKPYLKLVEPIFKQKVANTKTDLRVRWVGFDYNGKGFLIGGSNIPPALEFSIRGGGGNIIQPYQFVGSKYWDNRQVNSMSFPKTDTFLFDKIGEEIYFATRLDVSNADPDLNNDGNFDDQGPIGAALTNARMRVWGTYVINGQIDTLRSEGPLFSITPQTNFTVRVLLEGYHDGNLRNNLIRNLASTYGLGGLKIKLYTDNAGTIGELIDSAESTEGYFDRNPENRNDNNDRFANVNFVFTDLPNDDYWVVVDHINHLPIMSRFTAPFKYEGDDITTWQIESGWDFTSWNGKDENILKEFSLNPYSGGFYTAYGDAYSKVSNPLYSSTGLVYNNGRGGSKNNALPAMVGGDVTSDGQINAADRIRVRLDDGTGLVRSDVTGDGFVNADDRTIVDRNFGKISSVYQVDFPDAGDENPVPIINKEVNSFDANEFGYSNGDSKKDNQLANGITYLVKGEYTVLNKDTVLLSMFIKNTGQNFGLANATFAVEYNSNSLDYLSLAGADSVIFSNDSSSGYSGLRSAPLDSAEKSLPDVRTIEVDYNAYSQLPGRMVPRNWTYLGTLVFSIKESAHSVYFDWHESTSVHSTDSMVVTGDGIFEEIGSLLLYSAVIESPNGGESYGAAKHVELKWNTNFQYEVNVYFEYTTNGGISWIRIDSNNVSIKSGKIDWVTPKIYSNNYLIRMVDADTDMEVDRSDNKFSIAPSVLSLSRPSRFDGLYFGGRLDSIKWTSKGYNKVRFEFSSDGGTSWSGFGQNISASSGKYIWTLPKVTTKTAMVRVIDIETDEVVETSDMFKILNGNMKFRSPREGTELITGKIGRISWSSSDIDFFDLQISTNDGISWSDLDEQVLAMRYSFDWQIPTGYESNNVKLRSIWNSDEEMVWAESKIFKIKSINSIENNLPAGFEVGELHPNPCEKNVNIFIKSSNVSKVFADIINSVGCKVKTLKYFELAKGGNLLQIPVEELPTGKYYIRFSGEGFNLIRELNIVK